MIIPEGNFLLNRRLGQTASERHALKYRAATHETSGCVFHKRKVGRDAISNAKRRYFNQSER